MRYVVIFEDCPEMAPIRGTIQASHLAFLETNRVEIPMAGGLQDEHGGPFAGGLWVFDVPSKQRAVELIESDPYFVSHPRKYRLLAWGKVLS